jgi:hypothetical protein
LDAIGTKTLLVRRPRPAPTGIYHKRVHKAFIKRIR